MSVLIFHNGAGTLYTDWLLNVSGTKFRKTLHRGGTALRIIKFRKRRFSGVKLWPGATCGPEICRIYTRILVAKCPGFIRILVAK